MVNWAKIFHKFWGSQGLSEYGCKWCGRKKQKGTAYKKALDTMVNEAQIRLWEGTREWENYLNLQVCFETPQRIVGMKKVDHFLVLTFEKRKAENHIFGHLAHIWTLSNVIMAPSEIGRSLDVPRACLLNRNYSFKI